MMCSALWRAKLAGGTACHSKRDQSGVEPPHRQPRRYCGLVSEKLLTDPSPPFFQWNEESSLDLPHFSLSHGSIGNPSLRKNSQCLRKQDLPQPLTDTPVFVQIHRSNPRIDILSCCRFSGQILCYLCIISYFITDILFDLEPTVAFCEADRPLGASTAFLFLC
jgi:hypothetical protein